MEIKSQKIVPFLWFNKEAEEAMNFYCSVFKDAKRGEVSRMPNNGPVLLVTFELAGIKFMALNGGPHYKLNESFSLYVNVDSQKELDDLWNKLIADGGEESRCGWLKDKFGLSWQIIPSDLGKWMGGPKSQQVMEELMKMGKIDMKKLQDAYNGK